MRIIEGRSLKKRYGNRVALDGLDIYVDEGLIYGLIGPNGAGKSTFIKSILGIVRLDGGELYVMGRKAPDKALFREIGYMPQEPAIYPNLSVEDNLKFFGRLYGLGGRLSGAVEEILDLLALREYRKVMGDSLSGGLQRRVSLGIALLHRPRLLLLDEPTVGIDPALRREIWSYIGELAGRGTTVLVTTHYMDEAKRCDKVGLIFGGKMIAEGSPTELMRAMSANDMEEVFYKCMKGACS